MKTHSGAKKRFKVTANGKLKRDLIAARLQPEIEAMYAVKQAS